MSIVCLGSGDYEPLVLATRLAFHLREGRLNQWRQEGWDGDQRWPRREPVNVNASQHLVSQLWIVEGSKFRLSGWFAVVPVLNVSLKSGCDSRTGPKIRQHLNLTKCYRRNAVIKATALIDSV